MNDEDPLTALRNLFIGGMFAAVFVDMIDLSLSAGVAFTQALSVILEGLLGPFDLARAAAPQPLEPVLMLFVAVGMAIGVLGLAVFMAEVEPADGDVDDRDDDRGNVDAVVDKYVEGEIDELELENRLESVMVAESDELEIEDGDRS